MKTIVLGPPGTGKTHTLLNEVDNCLNKQRRIKLGILLLLKKQQMKQKKEPLRNLI